MGFSIFTKLLLPYLLLDLGSEVGVRCGKMYRSRHKMKPRWGWGSWGPFVIRSLSEEARTQVFFFFLLKSYGTVGGSEVGYYYIPLREETEACWEIPSLVQGCITWFLQVPLGSSPSSFPRAALFSRVERLLWIPSHGMWAQIRKGSRKKCLAFKSVPWA